MIYRVTHRTTYRYEEEVSASYGQVHLLPRELDGQSCQASRVVIDPTPDDFRERADFFGNRAAFFAILSGHRSLTVTTTSDVLVDGRQATLSLLGEQPWEEVRRRVTGGRNGGDGVPADHATLEAAQFLIDSPLVSVSPALADYARPSFTPGRPVLDALPDLAQRIHDDFEYEPGATTVGTMAEDVLSVGKGVCQDFAHLVIGCLRSIGLATRYVSGYLESDPPSGRERLAGGDVSHAWASLLVPGAGWIDVDPTNRQFVNDRYVTTAWGRDYSDIPPLEGVIYTEGLEHELEVLVDAVLLPDSG
jgi:transglutaminase-like putative cysteine protease